jgi:hypothetical protein
MTARRWLGTASLAALAALALAACTTIPSSGPVNEGAGVVSSSKPFVPFAEGPRVDDSPTGIVNGFVSASSAGFASDFTVAREYLTPAAAAAWDPNAQVTVFDSAALQTDFDKDTSAVTYDIPVFATIDDSGRLTEAADGTRETLSFTLELNAEGQWRIAELDDGTILARDNFARLFMPVNLVFASVDETTQVPELRWLQRNKAVTVAARELVEGPSPWLAPAVHTGFPASSGLAVDSVVVTDGIASVQLTAASAGDAAQRSLAQEQMRLTLASIPGTTSVTVTTGGVALGGDNSAKLDPAPLPSTDAVAFINDRLGLWDGTEAWQVRNPVGKLPEGSSGIAQGFKRLTAAWIVNGSTLVMSKALEDGVDSLVAAKDDVSVPGAIMKTQTLYEGAALIAPSVDRHAWVWTATADPAGEFVAVKEDGTTVKIPVDWLRATTVQALAVSRDGARIAVLSRTGGKQTLEVASIVRSENGEPLTIGEPLTVGTDIGPAIDLAWVDSFTIAALGEAAVDVGNGLWLVDVGGLTESQKAVTGAVDITARESERSLVVVDSEQQVFARSGTVWSQVATGPVELAYSG